jgi:hypothetical protein
MAIPHNNWVSASEISIRSMNTMRGKMCSLIEGMNLPNKDQEEAIITLLKQFSYDTQEVISQLLQEVDEDNKKFRYNNRLLESK